MSAAQMLADRGIQQAKEKGRNDGQTWADKDQHFVRRPKNPYPADVQRATAWIEGFVWALSKYRP